MSGYSCNICYIHGFDWLINYTFDKDTSYNISDFVHIIYKKRFLVFNFKVHPLAKNNIIARRNHRNIIGLSWNKIVSSYNGWSVLLSVQMALYKSKNKRFMRVKLNYLLQKGTNSKDLINLFKESLTVFHYGIQIQMH